jgi:hypothetical protein
MAYCYTLQSCSPLLYPDITNLCWDSPHPQDNLFVYVNEIFRGQAIASGLTYQLIFDGIDVNICDDYVPLLQALFFQSCTPAYGIFRYRNCENNSIIRKFGFPIIDPVNNVLRIDGDCDCWEFAGEDSVADEILSSYREYADCNECYNSRLTDLCPSGERSLSYAVKVKLPKEPAPDRGFDVCCYENVVLADLVDGQSYKNDFTGTYFNKTTPNDTVVFKLVELSTMTEYLLNDATYGEFQDFGGIQPDLSYYIVDWRKVLTVLGEGNYQIKKELTIAGIVIPPSFSNTFTLKPFSIENADLTVRIDCIQNGTLVRKNVNFKGTNYRTSLRVRGFFGRAERTIEEDILFKRDYDTQQVSMNIPIEYKFQGLNLPICITDELFDFVLFGNELFISDYNKNNHNYEYELIPVRLQDNEGTEYFTRVRPANVNLTFTDRFNNNRKLNC